MVPWWHKVSYYGYWDIKVTHLHVHRGAPELRYRLDKYLLSI